MEQTFLKQYQEDKWWQPNQRVLLAVSTGVDSMVLLHLIEQLPAKFKPDFGVVHINHQLRQASETEQTFLENYCKNRQIPLYVRVWHQGKACQKSTELKAREFRYGQFDQIMKKEDYQVLLTAHHGDDQLETMLMRLIKGGQLYHLSGIKKISYRSGYQISRPLLGFSKADLEDYAKEHQLVFFEDETNCTNDFFRNRMRHQVIPLLKEENPKLLENIASYGEQLVNSEEIIQAHIEPIYKELISETKGKIQLDVTKFKQLTKSEQYYVWTMIVDQELLPKGVELNRRQLMGILAILNGAEPQKIIQLKEGWIFEKSYEYGYLFQDLRYNQEREEESNTECYQLTLNNSCFLNSREWIGLYESETMANFPKEVESWGSQELIIPKDVLFPLTIRRRLPGDRLVMDQTGQHKKISRFFIDQKIPQSERDNAWIVCDQNKKILWLYPFRRSYLSIDKETDKIHYKLIFKENK